MTHEKVHHLHVVPPTAACPQCGVDLIIPDEPLAPITCEKCGPATFADSDVRTHAYLRAAADSVGAPAGSQVVKRTQVTETSRGRFEFRDDGANPLYCIEAATADECERALPASQVDPRGIASLIDGLPQVALSSLLLGQSSNCVVLEIAPALATKLANGTAAFQNAVTGGYRANIIDVAKNVVVGQASWVPATAASATLGVTMGWQLLSFLVAQKHLCDIRSRLDWIEQSLTRLIDQLDQDLVADIRGDAEHLFALGRTLDKRDSDGVVERRAADEIIRLGRARHSKFTERLQKAGELLTGDRSAKWFGQTRETAARKLETDVGRLNHLMSSLRLNFLLVVAATELLRRLGKDSAYTQSLDVDLEKMLVDDDARFSAIVGRASNSIMSLKSLFRTESTDSVARIRIAATLWAGARTSSGLRHEFARNKMSAEFNPPRLLVNLGHDHAVQSVAWIDAASARTGLQSRP